MTDRFGALKGGRGRMPPENLSLRCNAAPGIYPQALRLRAFYSDLVCKFHGDSTVVVP